MLGSSIAYIPVLILLSATVIPVPALASAEAGAAGGVGGAAIFWGFAAFNASVVAAAAVVKRMTQGASRREARRRRPNRKVAFTITNDTIEIGTLLDRTSEFGEDNGLPIKTVFDLCLALEEMLSYVISNGFDEGRRASIRVRIHLEKDRARLAVEYEGREIDPLQAPNIDIKMPIEDLPLDGWDLHLLHRLVDDIGYERSGGKNTFTVVKKWEDTGEAALC